MLQVVRPLRIFDKQPTYLFTCLILSPLDLQLLKSKILIRLLS